MTTTLNPAMEHQHKRTDQDLGQSATDFGSFAALQPFVEHGALWGIERYFLDQSWKLLQHADFTDRRPVMICYYGLPDAGESSSKFPEQAIHYFRTENIARISAERRDIFKFDKVEPHSSSTSLEISSGTEVPSEEHNRQMAILLDKLFIAAKDEHFEPGKESEYSMSLEKLAKRSPESIWRFLKRRLAAPRQDVEVLGEMLRWTGRTEIPGPLADKLSLLVAGLSHASSLVRDGAAVGLSHLEHPSAVRYLRNAAQREQVPELREDLLHIAESLGVQST